MDSRRDKLNAWRIATGRTPMKKMSYVQEYHQSSPKPQPLKENVIIVHPTIHKSFSEKRPASAGGKRQPCNKLKLSRSTKVPTYKTSRPMAVVTVSKTPQKQDFKTSSKSVSRREKLDKWISRHGSSVQKRQHGIKPHKAQTEVKATQVSTRVPPYSPATMLKLKVQFQKEIDEDSQEFEECCDVAKELDFSDGDTPSVSHNVTSSRKSMLLDPSLMFRSSIIRYSLAKSEPRRNKSNRRHTMSVVSSPEGKRMVYLTPVRRSTRKNRKIETGMCVDSPSLVQGYSSNEIKMLPNEALDLSEI